MVRGMVIYMLYGYVDMLHTYVHIIFCDSNHYTKDEETVLAKCSVRQRQGNIVMHVVSQSKSVSLNTYKM